jgi:Cdc6-like AAA superfamily ATPase
LIRAADLCRFLLATLQCTRLTHLTRRSEVRRALKILPSGLEAAYEESMGRIEVESPERKSIAMTALSWIYHTRRLLSINELLVEIRCLRHLIENAL